MLRDIEGLTKDEDVTDMKNDTKKEWTVMAVLLLISSLFGLAGFLVGRSAYGKTVGK